jgi:hypothetical protein
MFLGVFSPLFPPLYLGFIIFVLSNSDIIRDLGMKSKKLILILVILYRYVLAINLLKRHLQKLTLKSILNLFLSIIAPVACCPFPVV